MAEKRTPQEIEKSDAYGLITLELEKARYLLHLFEDMTESGNEIEDGAINALTEAIIIKIDAASERLETFHQLVFVSE